MLIRHEPRMTCGDFIVPPDVSLPPQGWLWLCYRTGAATTIWKLGCLLEPTPAGAGRQASCISYSSPGRSLLPAVRAFIDHLAAEFAVLSLND
jgi:hypothetical protein